jgi:hypothetical protein
MIVNIGIKCGLHLSTTAVGVPASLDWVLNGFWLHTRFKGALKLLEFCKLLGGFNVVNMSKNVSLGCQDLAERGALYKPHGSGRLLIPVFSAFPVDACYFQKKW